MNNLGIVGRAVLMENGLVEGKALMLPGQDSRAKRTMNRAKASYLYNKGKGFIRDNPYKVGGALLTAGGLYAANRYRKTRNKRLDRAREAFAIAEMNLMEAEKDAKKESRTRKALRYAGKGALVAGGVGLAGLGAYGAVGAGRSLRRDYNGGVGVGQSVRNAGRNAFRYMTKRPVKLAREYAMSKRKSPVETYRLHKQRGNSSPFGNR